MLIYLHNSINNNNDLSKDVAQRIADLVATIDPDIENVYISVNPICSLLPSISMIE